MDFRLQPFGDHAVRIELGSTISADILAKIRVITSYLDNNPPVWMIEYIPAYSTITIFYHPVIISKLFKQQILPYEVVCQLASEILSKCTLHSVTDSRIVEIPVCYGGELGPDLETVANINGLTKDEVIQIHSTGDYIVYMIGFAPGFPYIGGMSERIAAPRLATPRLKIPERSVGIAGMQTGIYSIETPGGWQLIGRTPLKLFTPDKEKPSLLKAGDIIRFTPISLKEYIEWEKEG